MCHVLAGKQLFYDTKRQVQCHQNRVVGQGRLPGGKGNSTIETGCMIEQRE
jgi:hypothetical protein